jgi:hypothetical protein
LRASSCALRSWSLVLTLAYPTIMIGPSNRESPRCHWRPLQPVIKSGRGGDAPRPSA